VGLTSHLKHLKNITKCYTRPTTWTNFWDLFPHTHKRNYCEDIWEQGAKENV